MIEATNLIKEFRVTKKESGLRGALKGLIRPERETVRAVDGVSFRINKGEIVGYLGPNGAGKSTTVKMLTGILHPTSGEILINGVSPHRERTRVVQNLGVVFGQRTQLNWDLRLGESFELQRRIYRISDDRFAAQMDTMRSLLGLTEFENTPVRQLSLGQRMRGDLAAAMLHSPSILFLDEPTIGLDLTAKQAIRDFIREVNTLHQTTIILTTHDLEDVEQLCKRLIVINHGRVVEDGPLEDLIDRLAPYRQIEIDFVQEVPVIEIQGVDVVEVNGNRMVLQFDRRAFSAASVISAVTQRAAVRDLSVREPEIADVLKRYYQDSA